MASDMSGASGRVFRIPASASGRVQGFAGKLRLLYKRGTQCSREGDSRLDSLETPLALALGFLLFFFHVLSIALEHQSVGQALA